MSFCCFLRLFSPTSQVTYLRNGPIKVYSIAVGGMQSDDILNGQKYENLVQFNSSLLASLRK